MRADIWSRQTEIDAGHKYGPDYNGCKFCFRCSTGNEMVEIPFDRPEHMPMVLRSAADLFEKLFEKQQAP